MEFPTEVPAPPRTGVRHDPPAGEVLVAVNGKSSGWDALEWAAAEAAVRGSTLRIVHAIDWPRLTLDPLGGISQNWTDVQAPERGELVLVEAEARARVVAPTVAITTHLEAGGAAGAIRRVSRADALVVVGRGHRRSFRLWSEGWRVANAVRGSVTSVTLTDGRGDGPSIGRVVVGVDAAGGPANAVEYAFRAASRRGIGLTAVHASSPPTGFCDVAVYVEHRLAVLRARVAVDRALAPYRRAFPEVDVRRRFMSGRPSSVLVSQATGAAIVVLGAPSRGRVRSTLLGSVARTVFARARSPVAIIREQPRRSSA